MVHIINLITMLILVEINHVMLTVNSVHATDIMTFHRTIRVHRLFNSRAIAEQAHVDRNSGGSKAIEVGALSGVGVDVDARVSLLR